MLGPNSLPPLVTHVGVDSLACPNHLLMQMFIDKINNESYFMLQMQPKSLQQIIWSAILLFKLNHLGKICQIHSWCCDFPHVL